MTRRHSCTIKQSLALAHGKYRARSAAGTDYEAIRRRARIERECEALGQQMCWHCERGFDADADICPFCNTLVIPF